MSYVTQADMPPTAGEIEQLALLFEAMHNKPAAWAVRKAGLCGTVHHATLEFLRNHSQAAYAAGKADERERCAGIAESYMAKAYYNGIDAFFEERGREGNSCEIQRSTAQKIRASIAAAGGE